MAYTQTSGNAGLVLKRYERKIIGNFEGDFPEARIFPGQGEQKVKSVIYNIIHAPAKQTAMRSEGTLLTYADAGALASHSKEFARVAQSGPFGFTKEMSLETFLEKPESQKALANHMHRSLTYQFNKTAITGGIWFRADNDRTYTVDARPDAGGSTTSTADADALNGLANDGWIGGTVTSQSRLGQAFGSSAAISDSVQTGGILTHAALPEAINEAGAYHVCHPYGLTNASASDIITVDSFIDMVEIMTEQYSAPTFPDGLYKVKLSAGQTGDLMRDNTWQNTAIYSEPGRFGKYQVAVTYNCLVLGHSDPDCDYRMTTSGVYSATGAVHAAVFYGAESMAMHFWSSDPNKGPSINGNPWEAGFMFVDKPDAMNLDGRLNWITWSADYAMGVKLSTHVMVLLTCVSASPSSYVIPY